MEVFMTTPQKGKVARQAASPRPGVQTTTPISPQAAMDTMMALYSDARRQLDAVELFLSSFEDKVQYQTDLAYGAWLGAEWRIQLPTLAETLRVKIERVYLPLLSAVVLHPTCSQETRAALRRLNHSAHGTLQALANLDSTLAGVPLAEASPTTEVAALRAAKITCRDLVCEFEDAMYVLDKDQAVQWTAHCLRRPETMVPNSGQYR
jgi:hypothetical protein